MPWGSRGRHQELASAVRRQSQKSGGRFPKRASNGTKMKSRPMSGRFTCEMRRLGKQLRPLPSASVGPLRASWMVLARRGRTGLQPWFRSWPCRNTPAVGGIAGRAARISQPADLNALSRSAPARRCHRKPIAEIGIRSEEVRLTPRPHGRMIPAGPSLFICWQRLRQRPESAA